MLQEEIPCYLFFLATCLTAVSEDWRMVKSPMQSLLPGSLAGRQSRQMFRCHFLQLQSIAARIKAGSGPREAMKAKAILAPADNDGLEAVFYNFCGVGHSDMDGKGRADRARSYQKFMFLGMFHSVSFFKMFYVSAVVDCFSLWLHCREVSKGCAKTAALWTRSWTPPVWI